jgi:hypothetical protein
MEKLTQAKVLRHEYLELMTVMFDTCLTGIDKAKAHMVGTLSGLIVTQCGLVAALLYLDGTAIIAMVLIVSALTLWWCGNTMKEWRKHKEMMSEYRAIDTRLESIKREYFALTGTDVHGTFTETEVREAFESVFKKRGITVPPSEH